MVNGKEIHIGNWVKYSAPKVASFVKIESCSLDDGQGKFRFQGQWRNGNWLSETAFEPIPFTPEIMERIGFKKKVDDRHVGGYLYTFEVEDEEDLLLESCGTYTDGQFCITCNYHGWYFAKNLLYVHQLQNLLDAIGIKDITFDL